MPSPVPALESLASRACSAACAALLDGERQAEPWEPAVAVCEGCGVSVCVHVAPYCETCRHNAFTARWQHLARFRPIWNR